MKFLSYLKRTTSSGEYIPEIDGLRFFAISSVVFFHLNGFVSNKFFNNTNNSQNNFFSFGNYGVELFFIISAFILSRPFFIKPPTKEVLGNYFIRRLTRLEPTYFINITIATLLLIATSQYPFKELFPHYLSSLFYLHGPIYGGNHIINTVVWSLEIEVQFYILMPIITLLFKKPVIIRRIFFLILGFTPIF